MPLEATSRSDRTAAGRIGVMTAMSGADWLTAAEGLLELRLLGEARAAFDQAEHGGADKERCSAGRWLTAMLGGDFEEAWRESDAIRSRDAPDPHRFWRGEELAGAKVMVRCLHGFGDAVQMLRYAPLLQRRAERVVFEVPPRFVQLAPHFDGVAEVISWSDAAPDWDVQLEVMELPYLFRTTVRDLPLASGYLRPPRAWSSRARWKMGETELPRVGIAWAAGEWNMSRSIPFGELGILFGSKKAEFWSLQGGAAAIEAEALVCRGWMRDANSVCGGGLAALEATIANLDLVITVDTLAAHLAGAMGRPTWLLLQSKADWRWMVGREDSPWYPTLRLFRQAAEGNWRCVVRRVHDALNEFTTAWRSRLEAEEQRA